MIGRPHKALGGADKALGRPDMLSQNLTSEFRSLNRCLFPSGDLHPALEMLRRASLTPRNRLELILKTQKTRVPAA